MSPNIYFPPPKPTLKLARASSGERAVIKLPPAASEEPATPATASIPNDAALQAAWHKLHRASELMEAEEIHLRDERMSLQAREAELTRREEVLARREAEVARREQLVAAATPLSPSSATEPDSAVSRFTRAPMDLARSILGSR